MFDCCAAGGLLNKLENPPVCAGGCDVDAPPIEGNPGVDAGFDAPRAPPNSPPVLAGCDAPDVPPPRLPNKLGVVPDCVFVLPPKRLLDAGAPEAAG